jgi:glycerol-3-phosphate dehydrogenase (NAD(P)+)
MSARVTVFGDGTMGTALAAAVASQGRSCLLWSEDALLVREINERHRHLRHFVDRALPASLRATTNLQDALSSPELAIVAVGSTQFRNLAKRIGPFASPELIILSATKGLEPGTCKRMSQILREETPARVVGAISGPNITPDIIDQRPTGIVVASRNNEALAAAVELVEHPMLRIFGSSDLVGVELLGSLKNVVVIAAGLAAGLHLGDNARALIVTLGLMEIQKLAASLGGRADTPFGLAGFGDLFLSTTSTYSRNHTVGVQLGSNVTLDQLLAELAQSNETAEGINTIRECRSLARNQNMAMPLAECVHEIVFEGRQARGALEHFLSGAAAAQRQAVAAQQQDVLVQRQAAPTQRPAAAQRRETTPSRVAG